MQTNEIPTKQERLRKLTKTQIVFPIQMHVQKVNIYVYRQSTNFSIIVQGMNQLRKSTQKYNTYLHWPWGSQNDFKLW